MSKRDVTYYQALPYVRTVTPFEDEADGQLYFEVRYPEIPNCFAVHRDRHRALQLAREIFDDYIEMFLEEGTPVPLPERGEVKRAAGGQRKVRATVPGEAQSSRTSYSTAPIVIDEVFQPA